jgi:CubicO group peptidase (beta-lactamase class C family)
MSPQGEDDREADNHSAADTSVSPGISRRRVLAATGGAAVAGGAVVAAVLLPGWLNQQHSDDAARSGSPNATTTKTVATPAATDPGGGLPLPSTLGADASPQFRAVAEALMESMRANRIPGTALGILADAREEHAAFGVASMNTLLPATPETLFQTGSLSKTFTATAIWRLIDEGKLALDAPVRTYIPALRLQDETTAARVTVGDLLTHTPGWYGDEGTYTGEGDDGIARFVAQRLPQLPQLFPLGKFFSYNNAAFVLLGRLIEVASGSIYNTAMQNLLLGPLGLTQTVLDRREVLQRPYSDGHYAGSINGNERVAVQSPLWVPRSVDPAGGIWSTTGDVIRYARFHLAADSDGGTGGIVSAESLQQMQKPTKTVPGLNLSIGRNWFVQDVGGVRAFMHNGDTAGQHTVFVAVPQRKFALVLFVNNGVGGVPVEVDVLDAALASYPGLAELAGKLGMNRALLAPPDAPTVKLSEAEAAEYAGRYHDPGQTMTFVPSNGGLEATAELLDQKNAWQAAIGPSPPPPSSIAFLGKDMGLSSGTRLPFVRDDAGRVGWVEAGFRLIPHTAAS